MNHSIKIAPVNSLEEVSYADLTAMMNERWISFFTSAEMIAGTAKSSCLF